MITVASATTRAPTSARRRDIPFISGGQYEVLLQSDLTITLPAHDKVRTLASGDIKAAVESSHGKDAYHDTLAHVIPVLKSDISVFGVSFAINIIGKISYNAISLQYRARVEAAPEQLAAAQINVTNAMLNVAVRRSTENLAFSNSLAQEFTKQSNGWGPLKDIGTAVLEYGVVIKTTQPIVVTGPIPPTSATTTRAPSCTRRCVGCACIVVNATKQASSANGLVLGTAIVQFISLLVVLEATSLSSSRTC